VDVSKYLKLYISESEEHLEKMDNLLIELEKEPGERAIIDTLFREAHSLKGMSASMGYEGLAKVAHGMEDFLDHYRGGKGKIEREGIDLLLEGTDQLKRGIEEVTASSQSTLDFSAFLSRMASYLSALKADPRQASEEERPWKQEELLEAEAWAGKKALNLFTLEVSLAPEAPLPAARAYLVLKRLQEMGGLLRASPSLEEVREGKEFKKLRVLLASSTAPLEVQAKVAAIPDVAAVVLRHHRVAERRVEVLEAAPTEETRPAASPVQSPLPKKSRMVHVDADRLNDLIDQMSDLLMVNEELQQFPSRPFDPHSLKECAGRIGRLVQELLEQAQQLSMEPLESIADRFPRAVRDRARRQGKEVEFIRHIGQVELDRAILKELVDPLLHLLGNAVDHGIEPPEERERRGKSRKGTITLEASQEKDRILITVVDDGRGIDPKLIRQTALETGIITKEKYDALSDERALYLIMEPGFSTAKEVSGDSGRGVGMDVIRAAIEALRGDIEIRTDLGKGTAITLKLPPSLAIIKLLLARVGSERYAIPFDQVKESREYSEGDAQRSQGQEFIVKDGKPIPLFRLRSALACPGEVPASPRQLVVLSETRGREVGVVVDELLGHPRDAIVKPLGKALEKLKGYAGVTVLEDGSMVLILDLYTLLQEHVFSKRGEHDGASA